MKKPPTTTRAIRIPIEVLERIKLLAEKRKWSVNAWIVNTLSRESRERKE